MNQTTLAPMDTGTAPQVLEQLLAARHSCRAFRPDPVPRADIERMLRMAQRTASWCNCQAWDVSIVSGAALDRLRTALAEYRRSHPPGRDFDEPQYVGKYLERRRVCGWQLYDSVGVAKGDRVGAMAQAEQNFVMFGAPHMALITSPAELGTYGAVDCGAYVSSFMLAAQSLGMATIAQAALALYADFMRQHLDLAPGLKVVCGVSFGYEDTAHPANGFRTHREPLDAVVHWHD